MVPKNNMRSRKMEQFLSITMETKRMLRVNLPIYFTRVQRVSSYHDNLRYNLKTFIYFVFVNLSELKDSKDAT